MIQTKDILKGYFVTGASPSEDQFADLIDSILDMGDTSDVNNITALDNTKSILLVDPEDGKVYKTTVSSILAMASTKNKTWIIKDSPSGNPADMQKASGNTLNDTSINNVMPFDVMTRNNVPLQWKATGVTYNNTTGFDFTAIGGLQDGDVITVTFI